MTCVSLITFVSHIATSHICDMNDAYKIIRDDYKFSEIIGQKPSIAMLSLNLI